MLTLGSLGEAWLNDTPRKKSEFGWYRAEGKKIQ
jgi:hypothetical protein